MTSRRTIQLGELHALGDRYTFKPASPLAFEGFEGEAIEFVLPYSYREAAAEKETFVVKLGIELDGVGIAAAERTVKDRPGVDDFVRGAFFAEAELGRRGRLHGVFTVDASYTTEAWGENASRPRKGASFRERLPFTIDVQ